MIVALLIILAILVSTALIGHQLEKAPEGFENYRGFHFVTRDDSPSSTISVRRPAAVHLVGHEKGPAASLL